MRRFTLLSLALLLGLGVSALAQDTPSKTPTPSPRATPTPTPSATPAPVPRATPAPTPRATPTPAPSATPAPSQAPALAPDLFKPTKALAALLAKLPKDAEPTRELKRAFLAAYHYLLSYEVDGALYYFHPEFKFHLGAGEVRAVPPKELAKLFRAQAADPERTELPKLAKVALLGSLTVLSFEEISAAKTRDELARGFRIDAKAVLPHMKAGDWLVVIKLDLPEGSDLPPELYAVLRRDKQRFKVVLTE